MTRKIKTPSQRKAWWISLNRNLQTAISEGIFNQIDQNIIPDDTLLTSLFKSPVIRLIGPKGFYPNVSVEIDDLTGLEGLTSLTHLFLNFHNISTLTPIKSLTKLKSLFIHNNQLASLEGIEKMHDLEELYCQNNSISSLSPVRTLTSLHTIYCANNQLQSFKGITKHHNKLVNFHCLPNKYITNKHVIQFQNKYEILCRPG